MAIAFDLASFAISGTGTSLTWDHQATGDNRIVLVHVGMENNAGQTVSSVTYGGTALALVGSKSSGSLVRTESWRLVAPATGVQSIVVTFSASVTADAYAVTYTGVSQGSPLGTYASAAGVSATISVAATSGSGQLVVDAEIWNGTDAGSAGAGQTERTINGFGNSNGAMTEEAGAASVTMSRTISSAAWAIGAMSLLPGESGTQCVLIQETW